MDTSKPSTQHSFTPSPIELNNSKMRELNMCQPCSVPHNDTDFDPIKSEPVPTEFKISASPPSHTSVNNGNMEYISLKQFRLLSIHEKLGHVSFSTLKLLAKCGIIPKELANIDPPVCPGCAYGKAHKKPTRYKGIKNLDTLNPLLSQVNA